MPRSYPLEKIRNIGIIAHIDASFRSLGTLKKPLGFLRRPEVSGLLFSYTGKLPFSRPLSLINMLIGSIKIFYYYA